MYNFFRDKKSIVRSLVLTGFSLVLTLCFLFANIWGHYGISIAGPADVLGLVYIFIGWIYGNHCTNKFYRETGDYGGRLPLEKKQDIMRFRYPLYVSGLLSILIGETFHLIISTI